MAGGARNRIAAMVCAVTATVALGGCTWFGHGASATTSESVFKVQPGQCFQAPKEAKAELSDLTVTPCGKPHTQESYAIVKYANSDGTPASAYPGDDLLTKFAQGSCAQHFRDYVGVDYLDSSLFFTYLLPSARGWESDDDRSVICFVTTTGATLTESVKGSKK